jgi:predicted ester cyclase
MSEEQNVRAYHAMVEALNARDFERAAEAYHEDATIVNVATGEALRGRDGFRQLARGWVAAFPDDRIEVARMVPGSKGEVLVAEYVRRGSHTGPLITPTGHIPPTGSQLELEACDVVEFLEGKIRTVRTYLDSATVLRQMGLLANSPLHAPDRRAALELYATEVDAALPQRNKAIVQRFLREVMNRRDPAACSAICSPNLTWHGGTLGTTYDLGAFQAFLAGFFASFPDLHLAADDVIAEADRVVVRVTLQATHLGEFQGLAATGERVRVTGTNTYRIANGRVVEQWWQHDLLGVLRQIEAAPALAPPSAGDGK